jgi:hypothetical protein
MKKILTHSFFALLSLSSLFAQQKTFTGVFVNREGHLEVISMFGTQGNYNLDIVKDGERFQGEAKDIGGGNLEGVFQRNKEKVTFNINYEKGFYFFNCENASIPLVQHNEAPRNLNKVVTTKSYTDHRYATGARVYDAEGHFAFNLPTEDWSYTLDDNTYNLQKEDFNGWLKVFPHELQTLDDAKDPSAVKDFVSIGNFIEAITPSNYGKLSYIRQYKGTDPQGRQMKFLILTIVSPNGGGLHIISGAHASKFEAAHERYAKIIADSIEFIHE